MLCPDCYSLLGSLSIIVPIDGIAAWTWEWQTLGAILVATIVVWLLIGAALEERPYLQKRVLAVLAKDSLLILGAVALVVCWAVAFTIATVVGVPPVLISP